MWNPFSRTAASVNDNTCLELPVLVSTNAAYPGNNFPEARVEWPISLNETGRVSFRGISWRARLHSGMSAEVGEKVLVLGRQSSTTLLVAPMDA